MEPEGSLQCSQQPAKFEVVTFRKKPIFYGEELLAPRKAGRPPLVRRPRLLIQYIRTYSPYLDAVVTGTHVT